MKPFLWFEDQLGTNLPLSTYYITFDFVSLKWQSFEMIQLQEWCKYDRIRRSEARLSYKSAPFRFHCRTLKTTVGPNALMSAAGVRNNGVRAHLTSCKQLNMYADNLHIQFNFQRRGHGQAEDLMLKLVWKHVLLMNVLRITVKTTFTALLQPINHEKPRNSFNCPTNSQMSWPLGHSNRSSLSVLIDYRYHLSTHTHIHILSWKTCLIFYPRRAWNRYI